MYGIIDGVGVLLLKLWFTMQIFIKLKQAGKRRLLLEKQAIEIVNAYEAEYLFNQGFKNVFVMDISALPLRNFKERNPNFQFILVFVFRIDFFSFFIFIGVNRNIGSVFID